jgi:hypothetical protein
MGFSNITLCGEHEFDKYIDYTLGMGITNGMLTLVGIVGNLLTVFTFWPSRLENATSFLLVTLAGCDTAALVFGFLTHYLGFLVNISRIADCYYTNYIDPYLVVYLGPMDNIAYLVDSWMIVVVAFHRFIAVCMPYRAKTWGSLKAAKVAVVVVVVAGVVGFLPFFFQKKIVWKTDERNTTLPMAEWQQWSYHPVYWWLYVITLYFLSNFIVPFCLLCYMTVRMVCKLKKMSNKRLSIRSKRGEEEVTKAVVVVVAIFVICQIAGPIRIVFYLGKHNTHPDHIIRKINYCYRHIFYLMITVNCGINLLIYCLLMKRFRKTFIDRVLGTCSGSRDGGGAVISENIVLVQNGSGRSSRKSSGEQTC